MAGIMGPDHQLVEVVTAPTEAALDERVRVAVDALWHNGARGDFKIWYYEIGQ